MTDGIKGEIKGEKLTIKLTRDFQRKGCSWVAYDGDGHWRAFAAKHYATNAADAAIAMFHTGQVADIQAVSETEATCILLD